MRLNSEYSNDCFKCKAFGSSIFCKSSKRFIKQHIISSSRVMSFKKGQVIFRENSKIEGVYCIKKGMIKLVKSLGKGNVALELVGSSDVLDVLRSTNNKYKQTAICITDTTLCFFLLEDWETNMLKDPKILSELNATYIAKYNYLADFIFNLKSKNMTGRVAATLLEIYEKHHFLDNYIDIALTRKDIAELSGTTPESVIKILNDFKKEKIIEIVGKKIKILNVAILKKISYNKPY